MGTLVELNSEPAVEDLSRKILSETKLWEAIQEARAELLRRRQEQVRHKELLFLYNGFLLLLIFYISCCHRTRIFRAITTKTHQWTLS